jgi:hypothetical protein
MAYDVQDQNEYAKVKVFGGNHDRTTGNPQTDFIIVEPGYPNEHTHLVFDQYGNQVYGNANPNH